MKMQNVKWEKKKQLSAGVIILCLVLLVLLFKAYLDGEFDSAEALQRYVKSFGIWAPIVLTTIQAVQVVLPVLPGFLGCAVGAALFGSAGGFWCNYIGITVGSIIAFFLAKKCGSSLVETFFSKKKYEKWSERIGDSKSYPVFMFVATLFPLFPDDFLCYFSGLVKMDTRKYICIIVLGKPWCILAYSYLVGAALS